MYPKHTLMYLSYHFNIRPHQYTMPYLMLLNNLQLSCFNSQLKVILIVSIVLLSKYSVQYAVYYFNDFIMLYMY